MNKQFGVLVFVLVGCMLFLVVGFPSLRMIKESIDVGIDAQIVSNSTMPVTGIRVIDLSTSDYCVDAKTGDVELMCESALGCEQICKMKGCSGFGLEYNGSTFERRTCACLCSGTKFG